MSTNDNDTAASDATGASPKPTPPALRILAPVGAVVVLGGVIGVFTFSGSAQTEGTRDGKQADGVEQPVSPDDAGTAAEAGAGGRGGSGDRTPDAARIAERLGDLTHDFAALDSTVRRLDGDQESLRERVRSLQAEVQTLSDAVDEIEPNEAIHTLEQSVEDLGERVESLAGEVDGDLDQRLARLGERVQHLEQRSRAPRFHGQLIGIDHWGRTPLAVIEHNGVREQYRRGESIGDWQLTSVDPEAGVAVLRHPAGATRALATEQ
ncbi:hypothetical protein QWY84_15710 [Aquisalimonas lutea]|uniref:hypothetical protein n=1 Tax=Aquisalimonas lutea TaxID=1327750 RepID=UPI0025B3F91B|nr:hypothetical protein [Aquisalimonas lutea]MDN3519064.1 hypothetical protein [Aquisalimonas lutea]